jgi:hypothetical protein
MNVAQMTRTVTRILRSKFPVPIRQDLVELPKIMSGNVIYEGGECPPSLFHQKISAARKVEFPPSLFQSENHRSILLGN